MKRNSVKYIVLALLLAFVSRNEAFAQEVSRSTAKRVAETFLNKNVRGGRGASVQLHDITSETEFQNFYIFSADSGFVLVAADERVIPILGYSKTGPFVTEDMPENLRSWLEGYENQIQYVKENSILDTPEIASKWDCLRSGRAEPVRGDRSMELPLFTTKWNQGSPYNDKCPRDPSFHGDIIRKKCVTGCTATAVAQVMKYWSHPAQGALDLNLTADLIRESGEEPHHTSIYPLYVNFSESSYDWSNMYDQITSSSPQAQIDAVSTLMYDVGVAMHMNYCSRESGAPYICASLKNYFDYSPCVFYAFKANHSDNVWINGLKAEIDSHRPVLYAGRSSGGGHAFVLYGYDNDDSFKVNWGWGGQSDGYYAIGGLNPTTVGIGGGTTHDYNERNGAIFYLLPNDRTLSPPANFNVHNTINFNELQLEWSATLHAESYVIMRNGLFLAETTLTSYLDDDIVGGGSYTYQVITIGENHRASLPSGSVTYTKPYVVTTTANPTEGGTTTGDGHYPSGELCTLTAIPNPGYIFKGWYLPVGLSPVNPLPTFTFTVTSSMNLIAKFQPATSTTDIYNYYCWFDQDYSTVQTGSFQTTETFFALDASTLSEGIHTLHVMLDDNGLSAPKTYLFLKAPVASPTSTYTYHCWFDQDYETVQTGTFGGEGYSFALDASELEEGIHTLQVMLEGSDLTAAKTYVFLKAPMTSPTSTYTYHCWFDQDYETVQTGTFGSEGYSFALDASELEEGIHTLQVMLEGSDLSAAKTYLFLKAPVASPNSTYTYHCWFDQDYETVQTGTFGGEGYSFALDASELDNGLHFVTVMLEGNELSSAKRYLFCKKPAGGDGIYRWEYCINGNWPDAVVTTFVPTIQTLDIQTMLPVDPLPIRSEDFEFEPNGGQPEIYAKNTITFRFWDAENRFLDRSAVYVDANVHEPVVAEWIERNTTKTIVTPGPNQIHWFKLDANVGDLLEFMADHECTIQLFSPSGEQVFASMSVASIVFNGAYAHENGIYYLAVHDVESGYDNTSVSYRYSGLATQSVALAQGWNWWAPTVNASLSQLEEALGASGISILSQSGSANNDNGQWSGTLESVTFGKMYKIRTAAVCSFTLTGLRPASVELSIAPGLNWFGFIGTAPTAIGTALNITPATGDKVISQDNGFAVYNGSTWEGTLTHLQPGCGYLYFSISSQPKTLIMGQ